MKLNPVFQDMELNMYIHVYTNRYIHTMCQLKVIFKRKILYDRSTQSRMATIATPPPQPILRKLAKVTLMKGTA